MNVHVYGVLPITGIQEHEKILIVINALFNWRPSQVVRSLVVNT